MINKKVKLGVWAICCFLCLTAVFFNINLAYNNSDENDWLLTNIEALAQGESGEADCIGTGDLDCNGTNYRSRYNW